MAGDGWRAFWVRVKVRVVTPGPTFLPMETAQLGPKAPRGDQTGIALLGKRFLLSNIGWP